MTTAVYVHVNSLTGRDELDNLSGSDDLVSIDASPVCVVCSGDVRDATSADVSLDCEADDGGLLIGRKRSGAGAEGKIGNVLVELGWKLGLVGLH